MSTDSSPEVQPGLLGSLVRLKLRLLGNTFKRSPWQVVGLVLGILYGFGVAVLGVVALVGLRFADAETARTATVIAGSLVVLGFLLVPLAFGVDDTLDPRRFSLFGIPNTRLATALGVAALISVPSIALTLVAFASVVTWSRGAPTFLLGALSAVLVVATCVLGARVTTSVAAFLLATRRAREFMALIAILALVLLSPVLVVLTNLDWAADGGSAARTIADIAAWTPLGAVWAFPGDAATERGGAAFGHVLVAVATVGVLWLLWRVLVAWMLVTPAREGRAKTYGGLGWFDRLPANPTGAIAARSATYWGRDPRYRVSLIMIPITPVLMIMPLLFVGVPVPLLALIPVPVMCLFLGWSLHNDVAYDNTAVWLHVASGTRGRADRWGRLFPALAVGVPVLVIGSVISAAVNGSWYVLGGILGVSASLLFAGMGFSSIMSARFPYPVVRPGDNPFAQPQSTGATTALVQSFSFFASLILSLPAIVFAGLGFVWSPNWFWASLAAGVVVGLLSLWLGVLWGSRIFDRRGPELVGASLLN
jgi:ABC-2 type transport system permease protein